MVFKSDNRKLTIWTNYTLKDNLLEYARAGPFTWTQFINYYGYHKCSGRDVRNKLIKAGLLIKMGHNNFNFYYALPEDAELLSQICRTGYQKVVDYLALKNTFTKNQLCKIANIKKSSVQSYLTRLRKNGWVFNCETAYKYRILERGSMEGV